MATAANTAYKNTLEIQSPSKVFHSDGENSMLGAIEGGEAQRENLEHTYAGLAMAAHNAYEQALPSSTQVPNTTDIQSTQNETILRAISTQKTGETNIYITSPESLTEKAAAREFKKAARDLSLGIT